MPTGLVPIHHHDRGPDQGQDIPAPLLGQDHAPDLILVQDLEVEGECFDSVMYFSTNFYFSIT